MLNFGSNLGVFLHPLSDDAGTENLDDFFEAIGREPSYTDLEFFCVCVGLVKHLQNYPKPRIFRQYVRPPWVISGGNARNLAEAAVEKGKPARRNNEEVDVDVSEMAV